MKISNPHLRHHELVASLVHLSDYEYQLARWEFLSSNAVPESEYDTIERTLEAFLDSISWSEGENLIGYIFRNQEEYKACLAVFEAIMEILQDKQGYQTDDVYLKDPHWQTIVVLAKNATVILHSD